MQLAVRKNARLRSAGDMPKLSRPAPPAPIMQPAADDRRRRHVRVVSVHVGVSDWVAKQGEMLARYVDLPFSLYTSANDSLKARTLAPSHQPCASASMALSPIGCAQNATVHKWFVATGKAPAYVVSHREAIAAETSALSRCILNAIASCDHGVQLHHLAQRACDAEAPEDDLLLFLDSDAWPLASFRDYVVPLLDAEDGVELVAVRRSVEGMALWPHPSFAVTTCGAWIRNNHSFSQPPDDEDPAPHTERLTRQIFDHSRGLLCTTTTNPNPKLDTGAPLWRNYNGRSTKLAALDRMNQLDIDPLFYGVYGLNGVPIAYHQGAGSRHVATSKVVPGPSVRFGV